MSTNAEGSIQLPFEHGGPNDEDISISEAMLGSGAMGTVFRGTAAGEEMAFKRTNKHSGNKLKKKKWRESEEACLKTLTQVPHENIVKLHGTHEDETFYWLVIELCSGVELLKTVLARRKLPEQLTGIIMYKTLSAVKHMHELGIAHRDIKPQNIIIDISDDDDKIRSIKLIDFGLACQFSPNHPEPLHTIAGTAHYMAPEVILGNYWSNCDEWSCGTIAYLLLSGYPPFLGRDRLHIFKSILRGKYSFRPKRWGNISKAATDFITRLLIKDSERMTAAQALADPWLSE